MRTAERGLFSAVFLGESLRLREHLGQLNDIAITGRPDALRCSPTSRRAPATSASSRRSTRRTRTPSSSRGGSRRSTCSAAVGRAGTSSRRTTRGPGRTSAAAATWTRGTATPTPRSTSPRCRRSGTGSRRTRSPRTRRPVVGRRRRRVAGGPRAAGSTTSTAAPVGAAQPAGPDGLLPGRRLRRGPRLRRPPRRGRVHAPRRGARTASRSRPTCDVGRASYGRPGDDIKVFPGAFLVVARDGRRGAGQGAPLPRLPAQRPAHPAGRRVRVGPRPEPTSSTSTATCRRAGPSVPEQTVANGVVNRPTTRCARRRSGASWPRSAGFTVRQLVHHLTAGPRFVGSRRHGRRPARAPGPVRRVRRAERRAQRVPRRPGRRRRPARARRCRTAASTRRRTPGRRCARTWACRSRSVGACPSARCSSPPGERALRAAHAAGGRVPQPAVGLADVPVLGADGVPQDWHVVHLGGLARGGYGLVMAEATAVSPDARITSADTGLWNETQRDAWARIVRLRARRGLVDRHPAVARGPQGRDRRAVDATGRPPRPGRRCRSTAEPHPGFAEPREATRRRPASGSSTTSRAARGSPSRPGSTSSSCRPRTASCCTASCRRSPTRATTATAARRGARRLLLEVVERVRGEIGDHAAARAGLVVRLAARRPARRRRRRASRSAPRRAPGSTSSTSRPPACCRRTCRTRPGYLVPAAPRSGRRAPPRSAWSGSSPSARQADQIVASGAADVVLVGRAALRDPQFGLRAAHQLEVADRARAWVPQIVRGAW